MTHRFVAFARALAVVMAIVSLAPMSFTRVVSGFSRTVTFPGQTRAEGKTPLRTLDGQPNLQGIWTNSTITPMERPRELAGKELFTEKEAADYEKQARERNNGDRRDSNAEADLTVGYNDVWWDRGTRVVSTS